MGSWWRSGPGGHSPAKGTTQHFLIDVGGDIAHPEWEAVPAKSHPGVIRASTVPLWDPPRSPHSCTWQGGLVAVLGGHWPQQVPVSGLLWGSQRCLLSPLCHLCPGSSWSSILVPKAQRGLAPTGDTGIAPRSPHSPLPLTRERQWLRSLEQEGGHRDTPRAAALL